MRIVVICACAALAACASTPEDRGGEEGGGPVGHALGVRPGGEEPACAVRGGTLGILDARTGRPVACAHAEVLGLDGKVLFAGSTDARGLVAIPDLAPSAPVTVRAGGYALFTGAPATPFGADAPLIELWAGDPQPRLRVLADEGVPARGVKVELLRDGKSVFAGQTNAAGALVDVPQELAGLTAAAPGFGPSAVNASTRSVLLQPTPVE